MYYGDLLNALTHTVFAPVYMWDLSAQDSPGEGLLVVALWTATAFLCWCAWWRQTASLSFAAAVVQSLDSIAMNVIQWPYRGENILVPQFLWALLIVSSNSRLALSHRLGVGAIAFGAACVIATYSPLTEFPDAIIPLLPVTVAFVGFHSLRSTLLKGLDIKKKLRQPQNAILALAGTFSYVVYAECSRIANDPGYTEKAGFAIFQSGLFVVVGFMSSYTLTTQIDAKKKEIRKQAEELRMVGLALEASETAIAIVNSSGQSIRWSNPAFRRLVGPEKEPRNDFIEALQPTEGSDNLRACFDDQVAKQTEIVVNKRNLNVEISPFLPQDSSTKHTEEARFLVALKDITEVRAREKAESAAELVAVQKEAMSNSIEVLSHELRTPLQGILGMTSLLVEDCGRSREETKEMISTVMASARLLLTLINNLLDVRRCDAQMMNEFTLCPTPLSSSLIEVANFTSVIAAITDVRVDVTIGSVRDVFVQSNSLRFQQIMMNLVSNAIKHTHPKGRVLIDAETTTFEKVQEAMSEALSVGLPWKSSVGPLGPTDAVAVVSVSDDGSGIPLEMAGKLFSKFQHYDLRTNPTAIGGANVAQPSGTGLGLNLCLKFIQRMSGNIWVNNGANEGASFSFYLPVVQAQSPVSVTKASNPGAKGCNREVIGGDGKVDRQSRVPKSVLIVDDIAIKYVLLFQPFLFGKENFFISRMILSNSLKVMAKMVTRTTGVEKVVTVNSGEKALRELRKEHYELVISDIWMPGRKGDVRLSCCIHLFIHLFIVASPEMSGLQLCRAIFESTDLVHVPVVVGLTAETSDSLHRQCLTSGMSLVLHKPVTASQVEQFLTTTYPELERGKNAGNGKVKARSLNPTAA